MTADWIHTWAGHPDEPPPVEVVPTPVWQSLEDVLEDEGAGA